jgi:hypothetical protein
MRLARAAKRSFRVKPSPLMAVRLLYLAAMAAMKSAQATVDEIVRT